MFLHFSQEHRVMVHQLAKSFDLSLSPADCPNCVQRGTLSRNILCRSCRLCRFHKLHMRRRSNAGQKSPIDACRTGQIFQRGTETSRSCVARSTSISTVWRPGKRGRPVLERCSSLCDLAKIGPPPRLRIVGFSGEVLIGFFIALVVLGNLAGVDCFVARTGSEMPVYWPNRNRCLQSSAVVPFKCLHKSRPAQIVELVWYPMHPASHVPMMPFLLSG